jgi:dynein heavy chain 2
MEDLTSICKEFIDEVKAYEKNQYGRWDNDIQNVLRNKRESLELSGKLMEIDVKSGLLHVHYSEKLVTMLKDVRQLQELGFPISKEIVLLTNQGKKFYKEGVTLRQVANFFNNMTTQILECH